MNKKLLQESAEYRLISLLLMPPEEGWDEEIRGIASEVMDPELKDAASAASREGARGLYHTLFGPGGVVRARAVSHGLQVTPGGMLAGLKAFYGAFGYSPSAKEPPDHVAVMTDFMAYLKFKQAMGHPQQARTAREASARFIREYLKASAEFLARDLEGCGVGYLSLAARALLRGVAEVGEYVGDGNMEAYPGLKEPGCQAAFPKEALQTKAK